MIYKFSMDYNTGYPRSRIIWSPIARYTIRTNMAFAFCASSVIKTFAGYIPRTVKETLLRRFYGFIVQDHGSVFSNIKSCDIWSRWNAHTPTKPTPNTFRKLIGDLINLNFKKKQVCKKFCIVYTSQISVFRKPVVQWHQIKQLALKLDFWRGEINLNLIHTVTHKHISE